MWRTVLQYLVSLFSVKIELDVNELDELTIGFTGWIAVVGERITYAPEPEGSSLSLDYFHYMGKVNHHDRLCTYVPDEEEEEIDN